ncbi:MAG: metallophosphoesterase [Flavobacteriaceae bacterium]|nr:metallophosphoesterase [Flavobacteriaceae bacterium]
MSRFYVALLIMSVVFLFIEIYAFQALKVLTKVKLYRWIWIGISVLIYVPFLGMFLTYSRENGQTKGFQYAFSLLLMFLLPKVVLLISMFGEDVYRIFVKGIRFIGNSEVKSIPGRRKFVAQIALGIAAIPFASFLYGVTKGKYNFKVLKYELAFDDLPEAFDGFTITQISDIHSGSFTDISKVQYAVDLVAEQQSDLLLFTGDIVNNKAAEMDEFITMFSELKAPFGKYSILGNHDYGDYAEWKTKAAKKANFEAIKNIHSKIGFELLLNESRFIEKDNQKLALVGVENWGKGWKQAGDLKKASALVDQKDFKVLMSHDPSHWEYQVKENDFNYQLTLSGHTHGLQMGIEIPGFIKWSPSSFIYKQWAGLYEEYGRYVNVNRGFGFHGFSGRVGIWPEITVIKLKKRTLV